MHTLLIYHELFIYFNDAFSSQKKANNVFPLKHRHFHFKLNHRIKSIYNAERGNFWQKNFKYNYDPLISNLNKWIKRSNFLECILSFQQI